MLEYVTKMELQYLQYWQNITILYGFIFILDPRAKLSGFGNVVSLLIISVNEDYPTYFTGVCDKLSEIFSKYEQKYVGLLLQWPHQQ